MVKKSLPQKDKKKIEKDAVKLAVPEKHKISEEPPTPDIEYIITSKVRYDINWFYLKKLFTRFEKWLISPYRRYEKWFNATFNNPKLEEVVKSLPLKEEKIIIKWKGQKKPEKLEDIIFRSDK
jgi:hypothetical protein